MNKKNKDKKTILEEKEWITCSDCKEIYLDEHDCPNEIESDELEMPKEPDNCCDDTIYCEPTCPKCGRDIDKCNEECEKHEEPDPEEPEEIEK